MNLALTYLWKEWRAQRALLSAYLLLVFACLCIGLYLAPRHLWFDEGFGVHALSWFVTAGGIGVVAFVVPGLVRGEFTANKGDQFVRRLPGALWPAFWGKLLFLLLALLLMPLLGLLVGELFVMALDQRWDGLFRWRWDGEVMMDLPWELSLLGAGVLLLPWVWAVGTWLPGGRLALLGTVLLVLVVGLLVFAVLRPSPNLLDGFRWQAWVWTVPCVGCVVAALSWARGRLAGGPLRSARVGLTATAVALLPGAVWLGERAWRYHHPRAEHLERFAVAGMAPSGRFAIANVAEHDNWTPVPVRIDLDTGAVEQLGGVHTGVISEVLDPFALGSTGVQRYWRTWGWDDDAQGVLDLETGQWSRVDCDPKHMMRLRLDDGWRRILLAERREQTRLRAPGGVRVWVEGDEFVFEAPDGSTKRRPWPFGKARSLYPRGHAVTAYGEYRQTLDFVTGEVSDRTARESVHVRGAVVRQRVSRNDRAPSWEVVIDGLARELPGVWRVLGLFDDERLLVATRPRPGTQEVGLELFDPHADVRQPIALPVSTATSCSWVAPMQLGSSLLPRDPAGCVWLQFESRNEAVLVRVCAAGEASRVETITSRVQLLRWRDFPRVLVRDRREIVEVDVESGARRVRFAAGRQR
ncbi:MAG: hypothetical protein KAI24_12410 [Planctomycetes bacterium]|nr:hypothetical protein [Planctomycetota bacterium]